MNASKPASPKILLFWLLTLSIPILLFALLEVGLRLANYGGNTQLFKEVELNGKTHLMPNRNFAARYFLNTTIVPTASNDVFLKEKPADSYRVFAIGGSSMAGFPYHYNVMSSHVVRDVLQEQMPDKQVEMCNLGISAINSYTLVDMLPEILDHQPDLVLIYAGHNEYYGALGVGSSEALKGLNLPGITRLYINLQHWKSFLLLRNTLGEIVGLFAKPNAKDATLMEQMVDNQAIALGSDAYLAGLKQFESNLSIILSELKEEDVDVAIGTLASNIKDFPPFQPLQNESPNAADLFSEGRKLWEEGNYPAARERLIEAKERDGMRFRAPEAMNAIIREQAQVHGAILVESLQLLEMSSPQALVGDELMLEHLHPNKKGYFLLGWAFAQQLAPEVARPERQAYFEDRIAFTEFDRVLSDLRIQSIMSSWPFQPPGTKINFFDSFKRDNRVDSLVYENYSNRLSWQEAKQQLVADFVQSKNYYMALKELSGITRVFPWRVDLLEQQASLENDLGRIDEAIQTLRLANQQQQTLFNTKILGALLLQKNRPDEGLPYLEQAYRIDPRDAQNLYNLSGAYGIQKDFQKARKYLDELLAIAPNFPGAQSWNQQLQQLIGS